MPVSRGHLGGRWGHLFSTRPELTVAPSIASALAGSSGGYTAGRFKGHPVPTVTRQWLLDGSPIAGATGATYTPASNEQGAARLSVQETAINLLGSAVGTSAAVDINAAPVFSAAPVILGTPTVGVPVAYQPGVFTCFPSAAATRQWLLDGAPIAGATGATYTPSASNQGAGRLSIQETVTNAVGTAASASSAVDINAVPVFSVAPVILGTPTVGSPVSYQPGTFSAFPAATVTRQWLLDGNPISGATGTTYTPVTGDVGPNRLNVRETATNSVGSASSTSSPVSVGNQTTDTTQPRRHATQILTSAPDEVLITYNETLNATVAASQFTLGGTVVTSKTVVSVTVAGNLVKVKASSNFVPGDAPTITYTPGGTPSQRLRDDAGNEAPSFSAVFVANGFEPPASPAALITTGGTSGILTNGGGGFVQLGSASFCHLLTSPDYAARQSIMFDAGWVEMQCTDTNAAVRIIALKNSEVGGNAISNMTYALRMASGAVQPRYNNANEGSAYTFPGQGANHRMRLYRVTETGAIRFDTSADGVSWTTRHTFATGSDPETTLHAYCACNSTTVAAVGVALQGFEDRGF